MHRSSKKGVVVIEGVIIPILIFLAWWFVTNFGKTPQSLLPKISTVIQTFIEMCKTKELPTDLYISLVRVLKGYLIAAIIGIVFGTAMGMNKHIKNLLQPTITTIRQIPIMAWIPL